MATIRATGGQKPRFKSRNQSGPSSAPPAPQTSRRHADDDPQSAPRDGIAWDTELRGFGLRTHRGRQSWIAQGRDGRRTFRRTLGAPPTMERAVAREAARALLGKEIGSTPLPGIDGETKFSDFIGTFLAHTSHRWKPSTRVHIERLARLHLIPVFGHKSIETITRPEVAVWHQSNRRSANWSLSVLSSVMVHAEQLGIRPQGSNPCAGLRRKESGFVGTALTPEQYRALGRALATGSCPPLIADLIRFVALTGARRGEAMCLRWDYLNDDRIILPDSKTGPKTIWLSSHARQLLAPLPRRPGNPMVFMEGGQGAFAQRLRNCWKEITKAQPLDGLRLHDLRHGYASAALTVGLDLPTVAGLLGHADIATTFMYSHLRAEHLANAADKVTMRIAGPVTQRPLPTSRLQRKAERASAPHRSSADDSVSMERPS